MAEASVNIFQIFSIYFNKYFVYRKVNGSEVFWSSCGSRSGINRLQISRGKRKFFINALSLSENGSLANFLTFARYFYLLPATKSLVIVRIPFFRLPFCSKNEPWLFVKSISNLDNLSRKELSIFDTEYQNIDK